MKGITQIIGSALLLAIGISIAGIYGTFASDFAQGTGSEISEETRSEINCNSASVDIRDLRYTSTPAVRFRIVNTGTVDLNGVSMVAISNTSNIINSTEIERLSVSESRRIALPASSKPEFVTGAVDECPRLRSREKL